MLRIILAAGTALLLGASTLPAVAETPAPEPPRNRLSPTDESEMPERNVPPPAAPYRVQPPPQGTTPQREATQEPAPPPTAAPAPPKTTAQRSAPAKKRVQRTPQRIAAKRAAPKQNVAAIRTTPRADTSLGSLFAPGGLAATPPSSVRPEARPLTYNYLPAPAAPAPARAASPLHDGAPCPNASRTSLAALFACTR